MNEERSPEGRGVPLRGVVGVIDGPAAEDLLRGRPLPDGLGGVELRADLLPSPEASLDLLARIRGAVPVLFTIRLREQGGRYDGGEGGRVALFRRALGGGAAMVDAEWDSSAARQLACEGAPLVLSYHDFSGMPSDRELERLSRDMASLEPRAVKVVPTAGTLRDSVRMLRWIESRGEGSPARVGFAMGEKGLPSRVLSIARGAPYTYASLGDAVAPGQPSARELVGLYRAASLTRKTKLLGVIGDPVAHSPTPWMFNPALARAGIDAVCVPLRLDSVDELERSWEALGLLGVSVMPPFGEEAVRLADEVHPRAAAVARANTLVAGSGAEPGARTRLAAYSTEFAGVLEPLQRRVGGLEGIRAAVVGDGAAARVGVASLREAGASPALVLPGRGGGRRLAKELGVPALQLNELDAEAFRVVIHAQEMGAEIGALALPESALGPGTIALDMAWEAPRTAFLENARRRGADVVAAGESAVSAGLAQFRLLAGIEADRKLFEAAWAERRRPG